MKTIILVRHSKSSRDIEDLNDIERPLNLRGYSEAALMSEILKSENLKIDKIISSPAIRAISTALIFAPRLKVKYENISINEKLYECGAAAILNVIKAQDDKLDLLMLTGHNPDFGQLVNSLIDAQIENYPTTAIAIISFNSKNWVDLGHKKGKLVKLLLPEQFRN